MAEASRRQTGTRNAHRARESRCDDRAVGDLATDDELLQTLRRATQLLVIAVTEYCIDRVEPDQQPAIDKVTADPDAGKRPRLVGVGVGTHTARCAIIAEIGTNEQRKAASGTAHLQHLQRGQREAARGVTLADELNQSAGEIGAPVAASAACLKNTATPVD
ncbi:MAG: hypothetical protein AW10_00147 [Candidatus Accumulibacter appositus]|uniref:Uncharacterized protein n=1 Tax=Candidatus Accumulibacter appositus TaxID=1454003 RepID=A0A011NJG5_9PROT|nr:MAG: hypothetical protein AW10_00147 [Candidatus Accumulibacter appositus]